MLEHFQILNITNTDPVLIKPNVNKVYIGKNLIRQTTGGI